MEIKRTAARIYAELCGTAEYNLTDEELEDIQLMNQVDDLMFNCDCCGWWFDISEMSDADQICTDCWEGE